MQKNRVLLCQSNRMLNESFTSILQELGVEFDTVNNLTATREYLHRKYFDLIILASDLPDGDSIRMARRIYINKKYGQIPILFIANHSNLANVVSIKDTNIQDIIIYPFLTTELRWRINRLLGRQHSVNFYGLTLDVRQRTLAFGHDAVILTGMETAIVRCLLKRKSYTTLKTLMLCAAEHGKGMPTKGAVRAIVRRLRRKFDRAFGMQLIYTQYGKGYVIKSPPIA